MWRGFRLAPLLPQKDAMSTLTVIGFDGSAVLVERSDGRRYPIPFIYADAALMQDAIDAMRAQQQIQRVHIADQAQAAVDAEFAQFRHASQD